VSEVQFRCFCSHEPLLAVCGVTDDGQPFVHVKAKRGKRLVTEVVCTSGKVSIRCRDCLRWHSLTIVVDGQPELEQDITMDGDLASMLEEAPVGG
jgi:hypothetical protein